MLPPEPGGPHCGRPEDIHDNCPPKHVDDEKKWLSREWHSTNGARLYRANPQCQRHFPMFLAAAPVPRPSAFHQISMLNRLHTRGPTHCDNILSYGTCSAIR